MSISLNILLIILYFLATALFIFARRFFENREDRIKEKEIRSYCIKHKTLITHTLNRMFDDESSWTLMTARWDNGKRAVLVGGECEFCKVKPEGTVLEYENDSNKTVLVKACTNNDVIVSSISFSNKWILNDEILAQRVRSVYDRYKKNKNNEDLKKLL